MNLIKYMAPVTPATSEEAFELFKYKSKDTEQFLLEADWPELENPIESLVNYNVIINGKMRFVHKAPAELAEDLEACCQEILATEKGAKHLAGKEIKKVIVKKGTIVFILKK